MEDASTVTIMVRLPNGTRASRRCQTHGSLPVAYSLLRPC